ncbi:MAG: raffinose/stachyose/melibiose transport system permease protein [Petroclostridium sp.]|jgi:raffinose/stachyose/melibiose transport system permease protein|nr:raffinose/stachyose/melibiose transport system permease protein [Petroclostridium sp.]
MDIISKNRKYIIVGLFPALLLYFVFVVYPIIRSFFYGFYDWNGLSQPVYIGMKNFYNILTDSIFWLSFRNNMFVVVASVFGQIPIGIILAVILSRNLKGARFFRSAFFMPMVLSTVVVGLLWSTILNYNIGILNRVLIFLGLENLALNWLGDPKIAMYTVSAVIIWQFIGLYMIIFLAAIQNIPGEIGEAADIDGASEIRKLFSITLPMLWPTVMTAVVLCISGSMRSFDLVYVMTQGGPANATELMATYMYNKTFEVYKYGYGSAVSLVIFVISFSFILVSRSLMSKKLSD